MDEQAVAGQAGAGITTLIFDVLGTVVDEAGSVEADARAALAAAGADTGAAPDLAASWLQDLDELLGQIRSGEAGWQSSPQLRRTALLRSLQRLGLPPLPAEVLAELARSGYRLRPWPDSAAALAHLAESRTVVALSNASLAELASMSARGGLRWHCVLSGELVSGYKPDPAVYRLALDRLELNPAQTMMVAAHPWDLRAAAAHGLRTAYVSRPGEGVPEPADRFDISAGDLTELARLLAAAGGLSG